MADETSKEKDLGIEEIETDELEEVSGGMCACAGSCQCPEPPQPPALEQI